MSSKLPKDLLSISTTVGIIMRKMKWRKGTNDNRNKYYSPQLDIENIDKAESQEDLVEEWEE
jgi:hypothetical protein